ncbi:host specificity protein J [Paraburkholderia bannensis]|uniref:host specificity protein J n=1 Tax=Paraburkholderia bannensis TaxID=765414 RepID=UPI002AC3305A|nr:phage tail protein [Paraburkholderia bannensis]
MGGRDLVPVRRPLVPVTGAGGSGGKGGGGSTSRSPQEEADSLRSTQYARVINLVCEGEIDGIVGGAQGIYCDDTPLQNADGSWNFVGAAIEWRTGTAWQDPISGFSATEAETTVGVTVTTAGPITRSVTNPNLNAIRVTLGFPSLSSTDVSTGDVTGTSVQLAIDIQRDNGGFQELIVDTVTGKTTSRYQRSYLINLARFGAAGGTYDVRVRRITPDADTVYLVNAFQWETMTEVINSNLMYPYSAVVGVQVDASTFKQIPKLSFDVRMRRIAVPTNYDPDFRSYIGVWDGTFKIAWTDNPAWILYDLATTARFGLGDYVTPDMVDKWTLYTIGQYCDAFVPDGFGGSEPRYTCNIYIQTREDAISLMQNIAAIFNGMLFWSGGQLTVTADMPADPVMAYTPANAIDGKFSYVGTPLNQRHTVALVTWNNPKNRYEQEIEYVEDRDSIDLFGVRETQVQAIGCTSRGQAHRIGRWMLLTEQMLSETVSFKTGINAAFTRPGDIFTTADPIRAGYRTGGRVLEGTTGWIQIDEPFAFAAGVSYTIGIMLPDGSLQSVGVTNPGNVITDTLWFTEALRVAPNRMCVWSLSASNAQNEQWRCLAVVEDEDGHYEIQGVAYRKDKFDAIEYGLKLETIPTGVLDPFSIAACTELRVTESLYQISPVVVGSRATFAWLAPIGAVRFEISYVYEQDSPVYTESFMSSVDIQPTQAGTWHFNVWAINSLGYRSPVSSITVEIVSLNRPPEDVQEFQLDVYNDAANLRWRPAENLDVIVGGQVIVRYSSRMSTLVTWEECSEIMRFAGAQSNGFSPLMKGAYLAKFVNSSGRFSENATYVISTTGPLRDYNVVAALVQQPDFSGLKVNMEPRIGVLYVSQDEDGFAVATEAAYYFSPEPAIDMGKVYTVRCQSTIEGAVYGLFDDVDSWPDWDARLDVDGDKVDEGGGQVLVQMTNVDPATANDDDWSPWTRLVVADLTFRAARFALTVHIPDNTWGIGIYELSVEVDVPDRIESMNNVPVDVGGMDIEFIVPFKETPAINIIAQDLSSGDMWDITQQSARGFHIAFRNAGGAAIAKTCDWIARGYGYEHEELSGVGYAQMMHAVPQLSAQRAALNNPPRKL